MARIIFNKQEDKMHVTKNKYIEYP